MNDTPDYYEVLGLDITASEEDIEDRYRALCVVYDDNGIDHHDPRYHLLDEAHEVLTSQRRRDFYDEDLRAQGRYVHHPTIAVSQMTPLEDLFFSDNEDNDKRSSPDYSEHKNNTSFDDVILASSTTMPELASFDGELTRNASTFAGIPTSEQSNSKHSQIGCLMVAHLGIILLIMGIINNLPKSTPNLPAETYFAQGNAHHARALRPLGAGQPFTFYEVELALEDYASALEADSELYEVYRERGYLLYRACDAGADEYCIPAYDDLNEYLLHISHTDSTVNRALNHLERLLE